MELKKSNVTYKLVQEVGSCQAPVGAARCAGDVALCRGGNDAIISSIGQGKVEIITGRNTHE